MGEVVPRPRRCTCGHTMLKPDLSPAGPDDLSAHCPACDRLKCGNCRTHVADPHAAFCKCGRDIRIPDPDARAV